MALRFLGVIINLAATLLIYISFPSSEAGSLLGKISTALILSYFLRLGAEDIILKISASGSSEKANWDFIYRTLSYVLFCHSVAFLTLACAVGLNTIEFEDALFVWITSLFTSGIYILSAILQGQGYLFVAASGLSVIGPSLFIASITLSDLHTAEMLFYLYTVSQAAAFFYLLVVIRAKRLMSCRLWLSIPCERRSLIKDFSDLQNYFRISISNQAFSNGFISLCYFLGVQGLADLAAAVRISQISNLVLLIVNFSFSKSIREAFLKKNRSDIREFYISYVKSIFILFSTGSIFFSIAFAVFLMTDLGGNYYLQQILHMGVFLLILSLGQVFSIFVGPVGMILTMIDREFLYANIASFASIVLLVSAYFFADHGATSLAVIHSGVTILFKSTALMAAIQFLNMKK